jgi:hypothetical protein
MFMKNSMFWDTTPCNHLERTYHFHVQRSRVCQVLNQHHVLATCSSETSSSQFTELFAYYVILPLKYQNDRGKLSLNFPLGHPLSWSFSVPPSKRCDSMSNKWRRRSFPNHFQLLVHHSSCHYAPYNLKHNADGVLPVSCKNKLSFSSKESLCLFVLVCSWNCNFLEMNWRLNYSE